MWRYLCAAEGGDGESNFPGPAGLANNAKEAAGTTSPPDFNSFDDEAQMIRKLVGKEEQLLPFVRPYGPPDSIDDMVITSLLRYYPFARGGRSSRHCKP